MVEDNTTEVGEEIQNAVVQQLDYGDSSRGKLIPFSYYGGKYKHLNWLLPLLPQKKAYVEPYGGSGVVLLNKDVSDVETFNDTFGEVTNFFKTLRDHPEELFHQIALTPYSEEDFEVATQDGNSVNNVEQARRFFVTVNQSYNNVLNNPQWSYNKKYSSRNVSKKVSNFQAKLRRLSPIADRLKNVQITNRDAVDVIETFDTEDGVIYCDPPYPQESRNGSDSYVFEMENSQHVEMCETLLECEADVAVSSYDNKLYNEYFIENGWEKIYADKEHTSASNTTETSTRQEVLYVNYEVTDEMLEKAYN